MINVLVTGVNVEQDQWCVARGDEDPDDHATHEHINGPKDVTVTVTASCSNDADYAELVGWIGKTLTPQEQP